jgi:serine/threonine-protein kinase
MAVLTKHMFEQPSPMSDPASGRTLGALEEITLKALEKKPEHRYQTMQELVDDLERVSGGQRPQFAAAAAKANAALADALEPRSHSEMRLEDQLAAASSGGAGRKRLVLGAAVAALVLVGTVLAVALSGGKDDASGARLAPPPPAPPPIATDVNVPKDPEPSPEGAGEEPPTAEPIIEVVVVDSDPSGVTVVMDGAIVGSTPVRLPRPRSGQRSLELRHDGYQRQRVDIDAQSPAVLRVTLRKRVAPAKVVAKPSSVAPAPKPSASRKTPQKASEVVDPWAN